MPEIQFPKPNDGTQTPTPAPARPALLQRRIWIDWNHGLGDTIQLLTVLAALRNQSPNAEIVVVADRGKDSAITAGVYRCTATGRELPLAVQVYCRGDQGIPDHDGWEFFSLAWWENYDREPIGGDLVPQTKPITCLRRVFNIDPPRPFVPTKIRPRATVYQRVDRWLASHVGNRPFALLHYQGNTGGDKKNLSHEVARTVCDLFRRAKMAVVLLDWDRRSPLPKEGLAVCPIADSEIWSESGPFGSGDAETIAAIADAAEICIGVDSGPLHVFLAVCPERTIGVWTHHHPYQFAEESPATHVVPDDWRTQPPFQGPREWVAWWEEANRRALHKANGGGYRLREYTTINGHHTGAEIAICDEIAERFLIPPNQPPDTPILLRDGWYIHQRQVAQDLLIIRETHDEDTYRTHMVHPPRQIPGREPHPDRRPLVIDVGAHIGTFARKWHTKDPSALIVCVEACAENIPVLQSNVGDFAVVIHGACFYEGIDRPAKSVWLKNAITAAKGCESTGGGIVTNAGGLGNHEIDRYKADHRPLRVVTLEEIVAQYGGGIHWIDCLKLDCEGAEFSILPNSSIVLERQIGYIVGEYHGAAKWNQLRAEIFRERDWDYGHMHESRNFGIFHLRPQPQTRLQTTTPAAGPIKFATITEAAPALALPPPGTPRAAPLRIALDYDDTYTRDPDAWGHVVAALTAAGHEVVLVTAREDCERNWDLCRIPGIRADHRYFTNHKPKRAWMDGRGLPVDIWIDDRPEAIVGQDRAD